MKPAIFDPEAEAEVRAASDYYDARRDGLGAEFEDEIERSVEKIVQSPRKYRRHGDEGLRKLRVTRFPYTIYYLELDDCVWIAAVAHHRRRPGYWSHRRPV